MKKPHIEIECKLIARDASALAGVQSGASGNLFERAPSRARSDPRRLPGNARLAPVPRRLRLPHPPDIAPRARPRRAGPQVAPARRGAASARARSASGSSRASRYRRGLSGALRREGDLGAKILGILDGRKARVIFRIRNRRDTYAVRFGKRLRAHVSLDDFTLMAGARRRRLAEVEIEIKQGSAEELRRARPVAAVPRLGLSAQTRAKFKQGLELAGLTPTRR